MFKKIFLTILIILFSVLIVYKIFFNNIFNKKTLIGTVESFTFTVEKREINIVDKNKKVWNINITDNTIFKTEINFEKNIELKISGEKVKNENKIIAENVEEIK